MDDRYEALRLQNQLCFPLYAVSNLITRKYKPLLDQLDLTYTQYIVMMVLWEVKQANEKTLCEALCLKSNTLAPLLRKLRDMEAGLRGSALAVSHGSFLHAVLYVLSGRADLDRFWDTEIPNCTVIRTDPETWSVLG